MFRATCGSSVVMQLETTMGQVSILLSLGEDAKRKSRTALCAPSAPMMRLPLSVVPSVKVASTMPSWFVWIEARRFPNCAMLVGQMLFIQGREKGRHTRTSIPVRSRSSQDLRLSRMLNGVSSALRSSPETPLKIGITESAFGSWVTSVCTIRRRSCNSGGRILSRGDRAQ